MDKKLKDYQSTLIFQYKCNAKSMCEKNKIKNKIKIKKKPPCALCFYTAQHDEPYGAEIKF